MSIVFEKGWKKGIIMKRVVSLNRKKTICMFQMKLVINKISDKQSS